MGLVRSFALACTGVAVAVLLLFGIAFVTGFSIPCRGPSRPCRP